jgi:glyoxylase-like metal-dependent hydrolase (beta-lactamase superfamily II)
MEVIRLTVSPLEENCFLLGDDESGAAIVFDPGDEAERIVAAVREHGWTVDTVLNTHGHIDHIGAAQEVKEALDAKFYLHPLDNYLLPDLVAHGQTYGIVNARVPTVDVELADGDTIPFAGQTIHVTHTPGHTPGHCIFTIGDDVICGDLVFAGSIGRTDLPGGDHNAMIDSLERVMLALPDQMRLHPGHGESTTVAVERKYNPFLIGLGKGRFSPGG